MPPLALDDQEMAAVMDAATLIDPAQRGAFLEALAAVRSVLESSVRAASTGPYA
jgi:hypothetical protein